MRSRAYRLEAFCEPVREVEVVPPVPRGREVLVRVSHCGVCHSDLHIREGHYNVGGGAKLDFHTRGIVPPITPGHEILGRVEAVGPEVTGVAVGDRRLVYPWIGCRSCPTCEAGEENLCATATFLGIHRPGGFADHVLVPHEDYLVAVDGLDPALAATYACSGLTVFAAIAKLPTLRSGDRIAVVGCGGLGQTALRVLKAKGLGPVIALDPDPAKREQALSLGAVHALDPGARDAAGALVSAAAGQLAAVLDFVGAESTTSVAMSALRKGGTLVIVGLYGGELRYALPFFPIRALTVRGSYVGSLADLKAFVAFAREVHLPPIPLEIRPLTAAEAALTDLAAGRVSGRIVLETGAL